MTAKLIAILETAINEAMKIGQYSAVAANAKVLMRLIGLDQQQVNHNVGFNMEEQQLTSMVLMEKDKDKNKC